MGSFMGRKWPYRGHGVMKYANGDIYIGQFCGNRRHGKGTLETARGAVMKGNWHRGKFETKGSIVNTAIYATGHSYEGGFKDGRFHGAGVLKYPNGDVYEGNFEMDRLYGVGIMTCLDGTINEGPWDQPLFDQRVNKNAQ